MKTLMGLALALCVSASAMAQAVVLDVSGAQPGRYYYQITVAGGGVVTVVPLPQVISLVKPAPAPVPAPDELTTRARAIKVAAEQVSSDSQRPATGAALAALYRELAEQIKSGKIKGQEVAAYAVKTASDILLTTRRCAEPWGPVRAVLADQWTALAQEGAADGAYAQLLVEAAAGLDASCADADPQLDMKLILDIMSMVLEILKKVFP